MQNRNRDTDVENKSMATKGDAGLGGAQVRGDLSAKEPWGV